MTISRARQRAETAAFIANQNQRHMAQLRRMATLTARTIESLTIDRTSRERARNNHRALLWAIDELTRHRPDLKGDQ